MPTVHKFNQAEIEATLLAVAARYDRSVLKTEGASRNLADRGHIQIAGAACITLKIEGGEVCLDLPFNVGHACLPVPPWVPQGTAAQACIDICTTFGVPSGVEVSVSVAGKVIVHQSWGLC
jgi:hypothetical protein